VKELHPNQLKLLKILKDNVRDPLTIRELQDRLNMSSPSVVVHHIRQLESKGYLRRNPSNPQDYQVLAAPDKAIAYINLYGSAACGPQGSILDGTPLDHVPIASKLLGFKASEAFMVKAKGKSMMPKIQEGDLVIARKAFHAASGSLVVCINDGEVLIKQVQTEGNKTILISLNPEFAPFLSSKDFRIEGIVKSIFSSF
jgi:repressor LexA